MRVACFLAVLLSACASHAVHCERRLQPINSPAASAAQVRP